MAVKIKEADILALMQNITALLDSCAEGFRECEDRHQCTDVFETVQAQLRELMTAFRVNHVVREPRKGEVPMKPLFVTEWDRIALRKSYEGIDHLQLNAYEDRMHFKARFYRMVNDRLTEEPLESLGSRTDLRSHIDRVVAEDAKLAPYLSGHFWAEAEDVLDTIADGIMDHRARFPQIALAFPSPDGLQETAGTLLNALQGP